MFPALLLLHPERAKPIVMFHARTMQPARERAKQYGAKGTMYPWEADPETGVDGPRLPRRCTSRSTTPTSATSTSTSRCRTTRSPGWARRWPG
ncbi:MAG: hypothetical protein WBG81_09680 [Rhodanobacter sp.]|uniref:hypothetical protein n=1 Tax=Rhodanobacter sp. KK11 TaxID=3083255 RepID=UPI0029670D85|nr:hypothetical protein [Rhodanobacter sp. KK11]MDW2982598.1 hypothetical protein [Rhodanobacter sp. KK11]